MIGAAGLFRWALVFRHLTPDGYRVERPGMILVLSAMIMLGVSLPLLVRSPMRMPVGERLFRLTWLGPIGRALLFVAGNRAASSGASTRQTSSRVSTQPAASSNGRAGKPQAIAQSNDRVTDLELRVAELERWRKESRGRT